MKKMPNPPVMPTRGWTPVRAENDHRRERGWKLFLLLPRCYSSDLHVVATSTKSNWPSVSKIFLKGDGQSAEDASNILEQELIAELSCQALEGSSLAPGTRQTLATCSQRPANLRSSRRGAATRLSGMTTDHLRPFSDHVENTHLCFLMGEQVGASPAFLPPRGDGALNV